MPSQRHVIPADKCFLFFFGPAVLVLCDFDTMGEKEDHRNPDDIPEQELASRESVLERLAKLSERNAQGFKKVQDRQLIHNCSQALTGMSCRSSPLALSLELCVDLVSLRCSLLQKELIPVSI